jgi:hypothetical protein
MDFRITITDVQVRQTGRVHFPATVEMDPSGTAAWEEVPDAPREVTFPIATVQAIADGPGTPAEKRAALGSAIIAEVSAWPSVTYAKQTDLLADALPTPPVTLSFTL